MIKKIFIPLLLVITGVLFGAQAAYAAGEWECSSLPAGSSQVQASDNSIRMYYSTTQNEGKANAQKQYDLSANTQICISFTTTFTGTDSAIVRRLNLQNSSLLTTEIINITGTTLKVFGVESGTLSVNTPYQFDIGIIPNTGYAKVYLNSEEIYAGTLGTKWKNFNYRTLNVLFRNTTSNKTSTVESDWNITNYVIGEGSDVFTSNPANNDTYVVGNDMTVKFSGIVSPDCYTKSNLVLTANGGDVDYTVTRDGNKAIITPTGGLAPSTNYVLTISEIKDVFSNLISENKTVSFMTAESGYVPASAELQADKYEFYDNESAYVQLIAQASSGIASTIIYVNDSVYQQFDGAPDGFDFKSTSGVYEIYAQVTDGLGGKAVSQPITLVINHNELPEITVTGVTNLTEFEASKLKNVTVSASDSDGTIEAVEVYIDDELRDSFTEAEKSFDFSDIGVGRHTISVIARDNVGGETEKRLIITVLEGYISSQYFFSNFNSYVSDDGKTAPDGLMFVLNGDAQLLASKEYGEEHGTVVVFTAGNKDISANGSWARLGTTNTRDGFTITMDVNLLKSGGDFYFMMKHPQLSALSMDVHILNGQLTLANGGSVVVRRTLTPGEWYTIVYKVDIKEHKYWFSLNDELLADEFYMSNRTLDQIDARFIMEFPNKEPADLGIALDNLRVDYISPITQITSIGYDDVAKCEKVSPYAQKLLIGVNAGLQESSINRETVQLYCGDERVNYESISYDSATRKIALTLSEKLRSDHDYTITLTNKVTTSDGGVLSGLSLDFKTDYNDIDISSIETVRENGTVYASGNFFNRTETTSKVYFITNIFNGKRLTNTNVEEITVSSSTDTPFSTTAVSIGTGERAEMYVWSSLVRPKSVTSRTYTIE